MGIYLKHFVVFSRFLHKQLISVLQTISQLKNYHKKPSLQENCTLLNANTSIVQLATAACRISQAVDLRKTCNEQNASGYFPTPTSPHPSLPTFFSTYSSLNMHIGVAGRSLSVIRTLPLNKLQLHLRTANRRT